MQQLPPCKTRVGLSFFPLTPADIEGSAGRSSLLLVNRLDEPFSPHVIQEGIFNCLGYIFRLPSHGGHWIAMLPPHISNESFNTDAAALLCDSLYVSPYLLSLENVQMLLTACAPDAAHMAINAYVCDWGCFLVGKLNE